MTASPPIMPDKQFRQVQDKDRLDGQEPRSVAQPSLSPRATPDASAFTAGWFTPLHVASTLPCVCTKRTWKAWPLTAQGQSQGAILVTWHGRTLLCANEFRNRGYWALISLSRDGEVQNRIFQRFGFQTVRGSTGRGGVKGLLQMARKVKAGGVIAFTPDGPRGPSHKVQLGVVLMAEKSGAPIIPVATSASRRWLIRSWDQYMIPQPFARAYFIVGEPIYVPPNLDEAGREAIAHR